MPFRSAAFPAGRPLPLEFPIVSSISPEVESWEAHRINRATDLLHQLNQTNRIISEERCAGGGRRWWAALCDRAWCCMWLAELYAPVDQELSDLWRRKMRADLETVRRFADGGVESNSTTHTGGGLPWQAPRAQGRS